jgi:hypothetical protein
LIALSERGAAAPRSEERFEAAMAIIIYLVLSVLIGLLGIGLRGGFFLYFILSIALSPLGALLIVLIVSSSRDHQGRNRLPRY